MLFGKVEGINALVNFEGESVSELTQAFHDAVEDYLAYCEEEGILPPKVFSLAKKTGFLMRPETCARRVVKALFKGREYIIPG